MTKADIQKAIKSARRIEKELTRTLESWRFIQDTPEFQLIKKWRDDRRQRIAELEDALKKADETGVRSMTRLPNVAYKRSWPDFF